MTSSSAARASDLRAGEAARCWRGPATRRKAPAHWWDETQSIHKWGLAIREGPWYQGPSSFFAEVVERLVDAQSSLPVLMRGLMDRVSGGLLVAGIGSVETFASGANEPVERLSVLAPRALLELWAWCSATAAVRG
jgi:hypothetical protein